MKLPTPQTPEVAVRWWRTYSTCVYCHQYLRHELHLYNHYRIHHYKSKIYWKLYHFHSTSGSWVFQRNYANYSELLFARKALQKLGFPTAVAVYNKTAT